MADSTARRPATKNPIECAHRLIDDVFSVTNIRGRTVALSADGQRNLMDSQAESLWKLRDIDANVPMERLNMTLIQAFRSVPQTDAESTYVRARPKFASREGRTFDVDIAERRQRTCKSTAKPMPTKDTSPLPCATNGRTNDGYGISL